MSEAVRVRSGWVSGPSPKAVGAMADTASAAEIAVRLAAGAVAVQVAIRMVRDHPLLSVLLASGIGYLLGNGWRARRDRAETSAPKRSNRA